MIPLSYVAEYLYCPRSAYYLATDAPKYRDENLYIQSGRQVHLKVDQPYIRSKNSKKIKSSFRVFSDELGIIGKADVLEFLETSIVPVEFKRGKIRNNDMHDFQIALIVLCLREMFPDYSIMNGFIFYAEDKKKREIKFTDRQLISYKKTAMDIVKNFETNLVPKSFPMHKGEGCKGCCFYDLCY
jgi:CRISPR-associated exonuclease Cas4